MTSPSAPAAPPSSTTLAYSVPATYTNHASIVYINGMFRVAFFEQQLSQGPNGSPEVTETLVPRVAVIMTPATAHEFIKQFGSLYHNIASAVQTQAASVMPKQGGGRAN